MKTKIKKVTLRTSAVIASILVALLLAELLLWLIGFEFSLYPSRVQFGWPDPVTIKNLYKSDKDLLWVPKGYPERVKSRAGARPSLVLMGCSCTQFGGYDRFLKGIIDAHYPDNAFTFVNLGVGGWSSYQGCRQLKRDIVPMKPRVVTVYYGWNDHWCTFGLEDRQIGEFRLKQAEIVARLSAGSRVVQLINKAVFSTNPPDKTASRRVPLEDFRANLKEIVRLARENSIIPVFLTAPSAHYPGEEPAYLAERWLQELSELIPLHEAYVQAVRDVAREETVHLVDLYRLFRDLPRKQVMESFYPDGIHLTKTGSERTAHYLYDYFVQTGLIKELLPGR